jgi:hypothetical protein
MKGTSIQSNGTLCRNERIWNIVCGADAGDFGGLLTRPEINGPDALASFFRHRNFNGGLIFALHCDLRWHPNAGAGRFSMRSRCFSDRALFHSPAG